MSLDTQVTDLSHDDLVQIVTRVREAMWPDLDPEAEWSADTTAEIGAILDMYDLTPD